jgi:DNA polymerase I-like protein with 3'-5' exonuclease and polymerase domains
MIERDTTWLDTETNILNAGDEAVGTMKADPNHPKNHIVYTGWQTLLTDVLTRREPVHYKEWHKPGTILVCHNIDFDLAYIVKDCGMPVEMLADLTVWDTMYAEYLLSGGLNKYPGLDDCAIKYGGTTKDSKIKEYWEAGIDTEDIPESEIIPYLEGDVTNLRIIFEAQWAYAQEHDHVEYLMACMDARVATIVAELNGMKFNKQKAEKLRYQIREDKAHSKKICEEYLMDYLLAHNDAPWLTQDMILKSTTANTIATAPKLLQAALYGQSITFKHPEPIVEDGEVVRVKSGPNKGNIKTKLQPTVVAFDALLPKKYVEKTGGSTDKEDLGRVADAMRQIKRHASTVKFLDHLLMYRKLDKEDGTYLEGFQQLVWHDGCLHGTIGHVGTRTTRTNTSKPNLANVSSKDMGGINEQL